LKEKGRKKKRREQALPAIAGRRSAKAGGLEQEAKEINKSAPCPPSPAQRHFGPGSFSHKKGGNLAKIDVSLNGQSDDE